MRLALIQLNPTIGDLDGNARMIAERAAEAARGGADLIVLPELALTGYPPRDLLDQESFCDAARDRMERLAADLPPDAAVLVGAPWPAGDGRRYNALACARGGSIETVYAKRLLPNYDVFDERRYFTPGDQPCVIDVAGLRVGLAICEDLWKGVDVGADGAAARAYQGKPDPVDDAVAAGAQLIVAPSASPFVAGKQLRQREIAQRHAHRHNVAIATLNQLGGNDDLVFDGRAAVIVPADGSTRIIAEAAPFAERTLAVDLPNDTGRWSSLPESTAASDDLADLFDALTVGVRDYAAKVGFRSVLLGVSGGIDSALTAAIAAAALGPDRVLGVAMPSRHSSAHSVEDAETLCDNLGCAHATIHIEGAHDAVERTIRPVFADLGLPAEEGVTEENIQSRIRGLLLMALSNKGGGLLLTTGNKSELAVGYCTLYGDMNGGLAVLSDVSKLDVYRLSRWINDHHADRGFRVPPIPQRTIDKPPSAELRPDQIDQDSLPPYEVLDEVIERYVERRQSAARILRETGFDDGLVRKLIRLIDLNEYKRKQAPIGLKVSSVAFGRGRRRPLAQRYRPA